MNLSKINSLSTLIFVFSLLLTTYFITRIISAHQKSLVEQREQIIISLTKESINQDLRLGLLSEVHRKCKSLYNNHNLNFLEITDSKNNPICTFGTSNGSPLLEKLYFDNNSKEILAFLKISFTKNNLSKNELGKTLPNLLFLFITFLFTILAIRRINFTFIHHPLARLSSTMNLISTGEKKYDSLKENFYRIIEINDINRALHGLFKKNDEQTKDLLQRNQDRITIEIYHQVAHDIKSPLAALKIATNKFSETLAKEHTVITLSVDRINSIVNSLTKRAAILKNSERALDLPEIKSEHLPSIIEPLIFEKKLQVATNKNIQIDFILDGDTNQMHSPIIKSDLERIISNLIDNSLDAIKQPSGTIKVIIAKISNEISIKVVDNGIGIKKELLPKLFTHGASFGKDESYIGGSGLGLYHAKKTIDSWNGRISIESKEGMGTEVEILLKKTSLSQG